jgi:hypothetical protein
MGTLRGIMKYRNLDSTEDMNERFRSFVSRGIVEGGVIAVVPGQLSVDVGTFVGMTADGMVVTHEGAPERLTVTAGVDQHVCCRAKYNVSADPTLEFLVLSNVDYGAYPNPTQLIEIARINLNLGDTEVAATQVDYRDSDKTDATSRFFIRGVVANFAALPVSPLTAPATGDAVNRPGDVYLATAERQFYRWNGTGWETVTDGALATLIADHMADANPPEHGADAIGYSGTLVATDVQAGLNELDANKVEAASLASTTLPGASLVGNTTIPGGAILSGVGASDLDTQLDGMYSDCDDAFYESRRRTEFGFGVISGLTPSATIPGPTLNVTSGSYVNAYGRYYEVAADSVSASGEADGLYAVSVDATVISLRKIDASAGTGISWASFPIAVARVSSNTFTSYEEIRYYANGFKYRDHVTVGWSTGRLEGGNFSKVRKAILWIACFANHDDKPKEIHVTGDIAEPWAAYDGVTYDGVVSLDPGKDDHIAFGLERLAGLRILGRPRRETSGGRPPRIIIGTAGTAGFLFDFARTRNITVEDIQFHYNGDTNGGNPYVCVFLDAGADFTCRNCFFDGGSKLWSLATWDAYPGSVATDIVLGGEYNNDHPGTLFDHIYCDDICANNSTAFYIRGDASGGNLWGSLTLRDSMYQASSGNEMFHFLSYSNWSHAKIQDHSLVVDNCTFEGITARVVNAPNIGFVMLVSNCTFGPAAGNYELHNMFDVATYQPLVTNCVVTNSNNVIFDAGIYNNCITQGSGRMEFHTGAVANNCKGTVYALFGNLGVGGDFSNCDFTVNGASSYGPRLASNCRFVLPAAIKFTGDYNEFSNCHIIKQGTTVNGIFDSSDTVDPGIVRLSNCTIEFESGSVSVTDPVISATAHVLLENCRFFGSTRALAGPLVASGYTSASNCLFDLAGFDGGLINAGEGDAHGCDFATMVPGTVVKLHGGRVAVSATGDYYPEWADGTTFEFSPTAYINAGDVHHYSNCTLTKALAGSGNSRFLLSFDDVQFTNCKFHLNVTSATSVAERWIDGTGGTGRVLISNCLFETTGSVTVTAQSDVVRAANAIVSDSLFNIFGFSGVYATGTLSLTGNRFVNDDDAGFTAGFIQLASSVTEAVIADNIFDIDVTIPSVVDAVSVENLVVTGNEFGNTVALDITSSTRLLIADNRGGDLGDVTMPSSSTAAITGNLGTAFVFYSFSKANVSGNMVAGTLTVTADGSGADVGVMANTANLFTFSAINTGVIFPATATDHNYEY